MTLDLAGRGLFKGLVAQLKFLDLFVRGKRFVHGGDGSVDLAEQDRKSVV